MLCMLYGQGLMAVLRGHLLEDTKLLVSGCLVSKLNKFGHKKIDFL